MSGRLDSMMASIAIWKLHRVGLLKHLKSEISFLDLTRGLSKEQVLVVCALLETLVISEDLIVENGCLQLRSDFVKNYDDHIADLRFVFQAYEKTFFDDSAFIHDFRRSHFTTDSRDEGALSKASAQKNSATVLKIACKTIERNQIQKVVDIGCGSGDLLVQLAEAHPNVTFVGYELSAVSLESAESSARARGLRNISFQNSDGFDSIVSDRQLTLIQFCLHERLDTHQDQIKKFLRQHTQRTGAALVVWEICKPSDLMTLQSYSQKIRESAPVFISHNLWHALTGQPTPNMELWKTLFSSCDLNIEKVYPFSSIAKEIILYPLFYLEGKSCGPT